jgi:hypothetical protein
VVIHKDGNKLNNYYKNLEWDKPKKGDVGEVDKTIYDEATMAENDEALLILDYLVLTSFVMLSTRGKLLKNILKSDGYEHVNLYNSVKMKNWSVHRLVAIHFIENPNNYKVVNHEDGNKLNNVYHNLEWCTHSQNTRHAYDNELIKPQGHKIQIEQLDNSNKINKIWNSIGEVVDFLDIDPNVFR